MKSHLLNTSSYEETLHNLSQYHKLLIAEVSHKLNFTNISNLLFLALRKNVEIGFLCSPLLEWEREAVFEYGNRHVFEEYYPFILALARKTVIPRKCQDYGCRISYSHIFPPFYYKDMICSFFVNFFEKPIFKKFNSQHSALEQELVTKTSAFFHSQNKHGPEHIAVALLDDQFITIMISGLLTPFLKTFFTSNKQEASVIEKCFFAQAEMLLAQLFQDYFACTPHKAFIHFDSANDKLIILASLSEAKWLQFLDMLPGSFSSHTF